MENFFRFLAEEVRSYLAELGFRTLAEAIGQTELLDFAPALHHWKAHGLDLTPVLRLPDLPAGAARRGVRAQDHGLAAALDNQLLALAAPALRDGTPVRASIHGPQRAPQHRRHARRRGDPPVRRCRPADGHHRVRPDRHRRPVIRRVPARRGHPAPDRRRQRLRRQGPLRWPHRGPPTRIRRRASPPRTRSSPATPSCTARPAANCSYAAGSASGSRCATPGRSPWSRASATTAAST